VVLVVGTILLKRTALRRLLILVSRINSFTPD
jgi:hypothetical protein